MKIELQGVVKSYQRVRVLDDISMEVPPGHIVALLGPNGAGKTTLLRCLAGIAAPDSGRLLYDGEPFTRDRLDMRQRFFFLPDFPFVHEYWTVLRHIGMTLRLYGSGPVGIEDRAIELLRDFDMLPHAETPFLLLSRGQRYKGAMAALLAANPEVWLLDEPFASGMDPHGINTFKRRAREAASRGATIIYSTQILDAAERFSTRVCVLNRGMIRAFDGLENLRAGKTTGVLDQLFDQLREEP